MHGSRWPVQPAGETSTTEMSVQPARASVCVATFRGHSFSTSRDVSSQRTKMHTRFVFENADKVRSGAGERTREVEIRGHEPGLDEMMNEVDEPCVLFVCVRARAFAGRTRRVQDAGEKEKKRRRKKDEKTLARACAESSKGCNQTGTTCGASIENAERV